MLNGVSAGKIRAAMPDEPPPRATAARRQRDRRGLLALAIYLTLWLLIFGRALPGHFHDTYIGTGNDASVSMWFFVWWPYALAHRLNPLLTDLLWAPSGINLAWTTAVPLPSFLIWPVTASFGAIAAFNIMSMASVPLAAWSAFILCRYVCRYWWPSLLGGYVFGFSAYMLGQQSCGHLSLTMAFLVPFAVWLTMRAIAGELAPAKFIAAMTALLVAQFLISIEILATMTAVGGMALFLGWSFAFPETGSRILRTLAPIAIAYTIAAAIVAPYLYGMFALGAPSGPIWSPDAYSADLLNFAVPAPTNQLGVIPPIGRLAAPFCAYSIGEVNAYVGLPLIILAAAFAWRHWREPTGKLLVDSLIIVCVLAMGPLLHLRGAALCGLPGKILPLMPALGKALPARFMMYAFLILAIITSLWFAASKLSSATKIALAAAIVLSTLPNLSARYWAHQDDSPAFFTGTLYRRYISPGENVLVLPFGIRGNSMLWQAETGMYFRMVGGWTGLLPPEFRDWPIVDTFLNATYLPDRDEQLSAFMSHHQVDTIAVADGDPDAKAWHVLASSCCTAISTGGGVTIYHAAPAGLAPYAATTSLEMGQRADSTLFDALLLAADRWLATGNRLDHLNPLEAQQQNLLDASWLTGPIASGWSIRENPITDANGRYYFGAWLGAMPGGGAGVGVYGSYAALEPLIDRYRQNATRIYFPYPQNLFDVKSRAAIRNDTRGLMVMEFDQAALDTAAERARADMPKATPASTRTPSLIEPGGDAKARP